MSKNTVNQPSRSNQEYVTVNGIKKRNIAYDGDNNQPKTDTVPVSKVKDDFPNNQEHKNMVDVDTFHLTEVLKDTLEFNNEWDEEEKKILEDFVNKDYDSREAEIQKAIDEHYLAPTYLDNEPDTEEAWEEEYDIYIDDYGYHFARYLMRDHKE